MDSIADKFITDYYSDICYASSGAVDGLKSIGDYETDGSSHIRLLFLLIAAAFIHETSRSPSRQLASFIADTHYYLDDEQSYLIDETSSDEKLSYITEVFSSFDEEASGGAFSFDALKPILLACLHNCLLGHETARQALVGAVTRFTYLMIHNDGEPSASGLKFYEKIKWVLSLDLESLEIAQHLTADDNDNSECGPEQLESKDKSSQASADQATDINALVLEVNSLIGLESIKGEVIELVNMLRVQQLRDQAGLPKPDTTNHMVFYGNPGTGKTTIARKLGEIYKFLGLLSKGHFVETDRSCLVAGYLGQTAIKTREVLESAKGGILFIDEAYTLAPPNEQDLFGQEAIDTLLKYMEDNRDDLVVIVAGYQDRMEHFISSNPGLKSRFSKYFFFPDYSANELSMIFLDIATKSSYSFSTGFRERLDLVASMIVARKEGNFGNGRVMRNLFDRCISNHANRVIQIPNATSIQLMELHPADLEDEDVDAVIR